MPRWRACLEIGLLVLFLSTFSLEVDGERKLPPSALLSPPRALVNRKQRNQVLDLTTLLFENAPAEQLVGEDPTWIQRASS